MLRIVYESLIRPTINPICSGQNCIIEISVHYVLSYKNIKNWDTLLIKVDGRQSLKILCRKIVKPA